MDINNFSLRTLLKLVPIDEVTRSQLLEIEPTLSAEEKYRLSKICWLILRLIKREEYRDKVMIAIEGIARGTRKYLPSEFESFEKEVMDSFKSNLTRVETEEQLAEVKEQLEEFKAELLPSDKTAPPRPQRP